MQIESRFPVVDVDGTLVTVAIAKPQAEFGDAVTLHAEFDDRVFPNLYVAGIDTAPAHEVAQEVLDLFGIRDTSRFLDLLVTRYGTGLPDTVPVTIYTLVTDPVESLDAGDWYEYNELQDGL